MAAATAAAAAAAMVVPDARVDRTTAFLCRNSRERDHQRQQLEMSAVQRRRLEVYLVKVEQQLQGTVDRYQITWVH